MVVINPPVDEKIENELQALDDEFQELKAKISELRKKGKDTTMVELLTLDFSPQVRMTKVTYDKEDLFKVKNILEGIKEEIRKSEQGSRFSQTMQLIKDCYDQLRHERYSEAEKSYSKITEAYRDLPKDLKRSIYVACLDLKNKLER